MTITRIFFVRSHVEFVNDVVHRGGIEQRFARIQAHAGYAATVGEASVVDFGFRNGVALVRCVVLAQIPHVYVSIKR